MALGLGNIEGEATNSQESQRCHTNNKKISLPQLPRIWGRGGGRKEGRRRSHLCSHPVSEGFTYAVCRCSTNRKPFSGKWESHQLASRDPGETERGRGHQHLPTRACGMTALLSCSQSTQHCGSINSERTQSCEPELE